MGYPLEGNKDKAGLRLSLWGSRRQKPGIHGGRPRETGCVKGGQYCKNAMRNHRSAEFEGP